MEKKIILSTLAGTVALFLVGGLIFGLALASMMEDWMKALGDCAVTGQPMLQIALANLVMALLLSILLNKFGVNSFKGGAINAAWIAFLIIVWFDIWMFATLKAMDFKMMMMDVIGNTLTIALGGGVIGWALGKVK